MLRAALLKRWELSNVRKLRAALEARRAVLQQNGLWELDWIEGLDLEICGEVLCDAQVPLHSKRVLTAALWGTLPSGQCGKGRSGPTEALESRNPQR